MTYGARTTYTDPRVVDTYEATRFSGALGRRRWEAEQAALARMFDLLPPGQSILDCPVGIGRWAQHLIRRGHTVTGADVSAAMLAAAAARLAAGPGSEPAQLVRTSADRLSFPDGSFDVVFSHALTKHLPHDVQDQAFAEFARVARSHVLCSFSVLSGLRGAAWRLRRLPESYGRSLADIARLAGRHGLSVQAAEPCTTWLGVEQAILFTRRRARSA